MIKSVRNWTFAVLFFGVCIMGLVAPLIWPQYYLIENTGIYGMPLVQHHVELCDHLSLSVIDYCEPFEPIRLA